MEQKDIFNLVYNSVIRSNVSIKTNVNDVTLFFDGVSRLLTINYGQEKVYDLNKELDYEVALDVVDIILKESKEITKEDLDELTTFIQTLTENKNGELVEVFKGLKLNYIPSTSTIILLTEEQYIHKLKEDPIDTLAARIANALKRREHNGYRVVEELANKKFNEFIERIDELEATSTHNVDIIEFTKVNDNPNFTDIIVTVDKPRNYFSIIVLNSGKVVNSSYHTYNNNSTINSLAWDYANFTQ